MIEWEKYINYLNCYQRYFDIQWIILKLFLFSTQKWRGFGWEKPQQQLTSDRYHTTTIYRQTAGIKNQKEKNKLRITLVYETYIIGLARIAICMYLYVDFKFNWILKKKNKNQKKAVILFWDGSIAKLKSIQIQNYWRWSLVVCAILTINRKSYYWKC